MPRTTCNLSWGRYLRANEMKSGVFNVYPIKTTLRCSTASSMYYQYVYFHLHPSFLVFLIFFLFNILFWLSTSPFPLTKYLYFLWETSSGWNAVLLPLQYLDFIEDYSRYNAHFFWLKHTTIFGIYFEFGVFHAHFHLVCFVPFGRMNEVIRWIKSVYCFDKK